jgi:hypothetical protein
LGMSNAAAMPNIKTHYSLSRKRMWGLFLAIALIPPATIAKNE